jgi:hypothetical protein
MPRAMPEAAPQGSVSGEARHERGRGTGSSTVFVVLRRAGFHPISRALPAASCCFGVECSAREADDRAPLIGTMVMAAVLMAQGGAPGVRAPCDGF